MSRKVLEHTREWTTREEFAMILEARAKRKQLGPEPVHPEPKGYLADAQVWVDPLDDPHPPLWVE